jgi:D-alanyl-D-alanine dipeptidase
VVQTYQIARSLVEAGAGTAVLDPFTAASAAPDKVQCRPWAPAMPVQLYLLTASHAPLSHGARELANCIGADRARAARKRIRMSSTWPGPVIASEDIAADPAFRHLSTIAGIAVDLRYATRTTSSAATCTRPTTAPGCTSTPPLRWNAWWPGWARHPGHTPLVLDALRPQRVQQELWDALEGTELRMYLANPERGSIHSFGMALDITLLDGEGRELDMGTGFDDMTELSHPALEEGTSWKAAH